jgi:DNA-directed RNA polymerase subunit M/transcription elongation factor TFIIS
MDDLPFEKVLNHNPKDEKLNGRDYVIVYDFTCISCHHTWRLTMIPSLISCPKCRSIKVYYVSKRSDSEFYPEDSVIQIPLDSELL